MTSCDGDMQVVVRGDARVHSTTHVTVARESGVSFEALHRVAWAGVDPTSLTFHFIPQTEPFFLQACAYKWGELKIKELRGRASAKLGLNSTHCINKQHRPSTLCLSAGDEFDVKAFHGEVLSLGNVPLWVLEQHIDNWIQQQTNNAASVAPATLMTSAAAILTSWILTQY